MNAFKGWIEKADIQCAIMGYFRRKDYDRLVKKSIWIWIR